MDGRILLIVVGSALLLSCPGNAPRLEGSAPGTERHVVADLPRAGEARPVGESCSFDVGCGDSGFYCDVGKCIPCPTGKYNCNGQADCECQGGCDGATCKGASSCDYYDKNACGGDSSKWCYQTLCQDCTPGWFNCNHTMGCECDSQGCLGTACAGKCSGGECP